MTKSINEIFTNEGGKVASLNPKGLSYFNKPAAFSDTRAPNTRSVNWVATTSPQLIIDETAFTTFVNTVNNLPVAHSVGFFKLIDKLFFNYSAATTHAALETYLTTDADISPIYVPGSFSVSSVIVSDLVYIVNGVPTTVKVPSSINFELVLASGSTTTNFILKLYTSIDAWIAQYNSSTIVAIIPPLPYDKIYNSSLIVSTDNIFATASLSATLSFNTTQMLLGTNSVSGMVEYTVTVTDGINVTALPFNILYKGRSPTTYEIRNGIKAALLASGVGNAQGWQARIPGVFVSGRFYLVPLWSKTYEKPDQLLFPNIASYTSYADITNQILSSLGYGDVSSHIDILSLYYNHMTATVIPDLSGTVIIDHLQNLIPDYQNYSTSDEQFSYMLATTQLFARDLNTVLSIDAGAQTSNVYVPTTENGLSFYSFTVSNYEICVITKICYNAILGSTQ